MEGRRNGAGGDHLGLWSRYRDHTIRGSSSCSGYTSAGTIVSISTGYTSNSSRLSSMSSSLALETAIHLDLESLDEDRRCRSRPTMKSRKGAEASKEKQKEEGEEKEMEEIKILVREFLGAPLPPAPADCSSLKAKGRNIGVLDLWLIRLGVGWVLDIAHDYVSTGKLEHTSDLAKSWATALAKITKTIGFFMASSLCSGDHGHDDSSVGVPSTSVEEEEEQQPESETGNKDSIPDLFQFAQFIQETMLKLLVFVDVIVEDVMNNNLISDHSVVLDYLTALLAVHDALFLASSSIRWRLFRSPPSGGVERIQGKIVRILSPKQTKVTEAIWSTMKQIWMDFTKDGHNLSCSLDTQESPDVHKATLFVVRYIRLVCSRYWSMEAIVFEAVRRGKYVPQSGYRRPLDSMIIEIASCLQETLANSSQFFLDRGLRFLFLLNNLYYIRQELPYNYNTHTYFQRNMAALFGKVGDYVNSYLQVSWEPMLSTLLHPTRLCFERNYSPLPKFEHEFQKTYTTQKLWKVLDPNLRKTLRNAIIVKIIPSYKKYIEDNKISTPKSSPDELKEMLEELFEG